MDYMTPEEISTAHALCQKIVSLRHRLTRSIFYNSAYSENNGSIPYNSSTTRIFDQIPGLLGDLETVARRAIERELQASIKQAKDLGIGIE